MKKRLLCLLLVLLFGLSAAACGSEPEPPKQDSAAAASDTLGKKDKFISWDSFLLLNCQVEGKTEFKPEKGKTYLAQAVLPAGMAVDHWELDGVAVENQERRFTLSFVPDGKSLLSCVLRPEKCVRSINAVMQLLDKDGKPAGLMFNEFIFEKDYLNANFDEVFEGGKVSVHVQADTPKGMKVDYWKINGVPYFFDYPVNEFTVMNLDESTVYEPVFRDKNAKPTEAISLLPKPGVTVYLPDDKPIVPPESGNSKPVPPASTKDPELIPPESTKDPELIPPESTKEPEGGGYTMDYYEPQPILPAEPLPPGEDVPDQWIPPDCDMPDVWYPPDPPNIGTDEKPDYPNNWPGGYLPSGPDDPDCPPDYLGPWSDGTYG